MSKAYPPTVTALLRWWRARGVRVDAGPLPLRAELFSAGQMEQHGRALAGTHVLGRSGARNGLLRRLDENQQVLVETSAALTAAVHAKRPISPAGEWLLDNFYLIAEQIRTAKQHLPKSYSRELPRLAHGASRGLPRVYDLALQAIAHGDGRVDEESLQRFVAAYQSVTPLTLGELWAIPIMLRLALIENLRRVSAHAMAARVHVDQAQDWANQMLEIAELDPNNLILVLADMARSDPPMVSAFVAELARRLQGHGPALALPLTWIERRLAESSLTIEQLVQAETQQQAADQVSVSNSIGSLRFLGATDWRVFVERMSCVEQTLRSDIGGVYAAMDFATRDRYRHVVDRLAKCSASSENEIARTAILLAQRSAKADAAQQHTAHVGYYLVDAGLAELERAVHARVPLPERARRLAERAPLLLHLGIILLLTAIAAALLLGQLQHRDLDDWRLLPLGVFALIAASQFASVLANWLATLLVPPQLLPRMDFSHGLPRALRTLVVVPTMLVSAENIEELVDALEVRFLGNRDAHLHFALLTDFVDAPTALLDSDAPLLQLASELITRLNEKHPGGDVDRFFLLHRPRRFNAADQMWMGHERKRGKLADLNAALRGSRRGRFSAVVGRFDALIGVKYVITLDTDTQLPRDSARQFVAAMAHPLNRPRFDDTRQRVCGGYGILQPRMAATLAAAQRSRYAQLCGAEPGIDPYTRSVSDVYQDLFGEGSFIGKGIYDVDAFERVLKYRLPQNRILSHDLLEGCYARAGLLSDVHLYEDYPARYQNDVNRQHRWLRGDWQIAHWILAHVPGPGGRRLPNPLSALSRFKIFDNLRRSLVPVSLLLLFVGGWLIAPVPSAWTLTVLALLLLPIALITGVDALRVPRDASLLQHLAAVARSLRQGLAIAALRITCLAYEAWYSVDAIVRTTTRMVITHRHLLEWQVAGGAVPSANRRRNDDLWASWRCMWPAPAIAGLAAALLLRLRPEALPAAAVLLLAWCASPAITWWLSRPLRRREQALSDTQALFLRRIARKTFAYFDHFVGAEDGFLVPDNYQEHPGPVLAHRTSPTNIGLALLANLAAHDFGYLGTGALLTRTAQTFATLAKLERHQGHFYNWYDTRTLTPLPPRYVSSVDSGNLAGFLLTLRAGLLALPEQHIVAPRLYAGLADTLALCVDASLDPDAAASALRQELHDALHAAQPATLSALVRALQAISALAGGLRDRLRSEHEAEARSWADALLRQVDALRDDLQHLAPWSEQSLSASPGLTPFAAQLDAMPCLLELEGHRHDLLPQLERALRDSPTPAQRTELAALRDAVALGATRAAARIREIGQLAAQAGEFATMNYAFLYDTTRQQLAIGYNVDEFRRDASYYDLLASEARLASFVAIAQGQLPQDNWFALGRQQATAGGTPVLVSWSGSMFEYLMPLLVMPSYPGSLLDQTCHGAVARQVAHGQQLGLPWGVSESGYHTFDASLNYQYFAFGVPGLGLKRGLADDQVIAPYASMLALLLAPVAACANLQRLATDGLEGRYGFYEAIDYTPARLPRGQSSVIVRSFMAHHQGMGLLALAHALLDRPMQRRFESDPWFQATLLLLQERIPKRAPARQRVAGHAEGSAHVDVDAIATEAPIGAHTPSPEVQLLSNGRYQVMLTNAGGGYSRCKDLALTRWREDSSRDHWGAFVYLRDRDSGAFWSATHQPTLKRAQSYAALFSEGRAEYRRRDHDIESYSEIVVSPEDDIELRRMRISNRSRSRRTIELTSYAEVVLAAPAADAMQTAFGNLFVQTELLPDRRAILCTRRPRSLADPTPHLFHLLAAHDAEIAQVSYETDRMRFIGRGRSLVEPLALVATGALSGSAGSVLDPIVAIRCTITLQAGQTLLLDWVTGVADQRDACLALVDKYQDRRLADRVFDLAYTHSGVTLRQLNVGDADAQVYRRLASSVLYANAALRAESGVLVQNRRGQSGLWGYAISGDLPIVLLKIADSAHIELARQMIQCHAWWRLKGLAVDLVIWNEDHASYRQVLHDQIIGLIATRLEASAIDRPGGIFVRSAEQISSEDRILLQAVARVIIADGHGTLAEQVGRRALVDKRVARLLPTRKHRSEPAPAPEAMPSDLLLAHPLGGFSSDGREYVIHSSPAQQTPLPWVNVLANAQFGSVISESGLAYSWSENAHEFRLTPWSDDAVGASGGEAIYLRDEESGHCWSPAPQPCPGTGAHVTRHGFGYSVFEHIAGGIHSELWVHVDLDDAVKFSVLKLRNDSGRKRTLSATGYVEWVLGDLREKTAMHVVTSIDASSGALFARNAYNSEFSGRVAFFDVDDVARTLTGDRGEFLGRNGSLAHPEGLKRERLSGRLGAALDPCGAIQVPIELAAGESRQIIFRLGAGRDLAHARELAKRMRKPGSARVSLERVQQYWSRTLGSIQVETPDLALNLIANGWLLYQTLACRVFARSGFYQSGGAYGFRDQLQDMLALLHAEPQLARAHLLRCAERQYAEGDVQHWWHPPAGRGVRTRCSDDYLWLAYATCHYVRVTGDTGVLDERVHFLEGRALLADEESYYDLPGRSSESASLYQHCLRAIEQGLRLGEHGLPLIGSGDWNDGMNLVGIHGRGESVWLGFFLHDVLQSFAPLAALRHDDDFVARCEAAAAALRGHLDRHAWDGAWYRRAWFDDGTALGSASNSECSIDSIAQSWSVLSGAADPARARQAMRSLDERLVRRAQGVVLLLDPPFDTSSLNPGYIKGYVPGVRENGGQYTHAAIWAAMAFAALGDSARAWDLLALINPIHHALSAERVAVYKAEPYVVAADVYGVAPHVGRGGWTWYTGSAGWLYRLIVESLLGLRREGTRLSIRPCLPERWTHYALSYRYGETHYRIRVIQVAYAAELAPITISVDGVEQSDDGFVLVDDHGEHAVAVRIMRPPQQASP